jgi:TonB family protein
MAYLLQIACIAALAEMLQRLVPVSSAGFRYAYWRLVLAGALLGPLVLSQPASSPPLVDLATLIPAAAPVTPDVAASAAVPRASEGWLTLLLVIIASGTVVRLLRVTAGVIRLRALRRSGTPVADPAYDEIQQQLGTHAELRSAHVPQPVTFGIRRPVVLLPVTLDGCAAAIRRAAVTHELIHVQRRDWLFVIGEEALRALFWFHPAIWWITARIRLTREEFTDHLAVLASGSRRSYIEALLTFADGSRLEPAPAFIRGADLFHRIVLLSKESAMSSRRIVVSAVVLTGLLGAGGWYASEAFPVTVRALPSVLRSAAPPAARQAGAADAAIKPITPENPIPRRVFTTPIPYPLELAGTGFEGAFSIRVVLNANGFVASAQRGASAVSSPGRSTDGSNQQAMEAFGKAAVDAIAQWQYEPPTSGPIAFYVAVTFKPGSAATVSQSERPQGVVAGANGARMATPADTIAFEASRQGATAPSSATQDAGGRRGGRAGAAGGAVGGVAAPLGVAPPPPPAPPAPGTPVRVGGAVRAPTLTRKVNPVYPPIAQSARVQGVVILEALIDEQGRVASARVLRSIPLLDQAALDAVRQWEYVPTLLNGAPTAIIMTVTVDFRLPEPAPQN